MAGRSRVSRFVVPSFHNASTRRNNRYDYSKILLKKSRISGALLVTCLSDSVGRKRAMYLAVCLSLIGSTLSFVSQPCDSFEVYMLARFLGGISCSLSTGLQTLYISEVALKLHRGALNSLTSVVAAVGGVVAAIVALPTVMGKANLWPYLHVVDMMPSVVLLCLLPFAPESPKWLFGHGYLEEARMAISFFHKYAPVDVDYAIVEMRRELVSSDQPVGFVRSYILVLYPKNAQF